MEIEVAGEKVHGTITVGPLSLLASFPLPPLLCNGEESIFVHKLHNDQIYMYTLVGVVLCLSLDI